MDILARSCQDIQELQDVMVRSYQDSHVSKKNLTRSPIWQKNLTKKPKMARKICYELLDIEKKQNQKNIKLKVMEKNLEITQKNKITG